MPDSPHVTSPDWTITTALLHVLQIITGNDRRYEERFGAITEATAAALAAADRAVQKAEMAAERRFEAVNEFRGTLSDQQRNLIPRAEVDVIVRGLTDKMQALEKQMDAWKAERVGERGGWGYAVGVVGFVLAVISVIVWVARLGTVIKATP